MEAYTSTVVSFVLALARSILLLTSATSPNPIVTTTAGAFRGMNVPAPNNTDKWLGIPFAQPPLGSLRFKAPVPLIVSSPHAQVQDAFQFGDACPQQPSATLGAPMSEDCLKLNVRHTSYYGKLRVDRLVYQTDLATGWNDCGC